MKKSPGLFSSLLRMLSLFFIPSPNCSSIGSSKMFSFFDASFLVSPLKITIQTLESGTSLEQRVMSVFNEEMAANL